MQSDEVFLATLFSGESAIALIVSFVAGLIAGLALSAFKLVGQSAQFLMACVFGDRWRKKLGSRAYQFLLAYAEHSNLKVGNEKAEALSDPVFGSIPVVKIADSVQLGALVPGKPIPRQARDRWHLRKWKKRQQAEAGSKAKRHLKDAAAAKTAGPLTFALDTIGRDGLLQGSITSYEDMIATYDAIQGELSKYAKAVSTIDVRDQREVTRASRFLKHRARVERQQEFRLDKGSGLPMALGVSTILVYPDKGQHVIEVMRRSSKVGTDPMKLHAMPAGIFQAEIDVGHPKNEWSVIGCFLKEYGEELFGRSVDRERRAADYYLSDWPEVGELNQMINSGRITFETLGVVASLTNYRPEICCLLFVPKREEGWWSKHASGWRYNWENRLSEVSDPAERSQVQAETRFKLSEVRARFAEASRQNILSDDWVPVGLAAFSLAFYRGEQLALRDSP